MGHVTLTNEAESTRHQRTHFEIKDHTDDAGWRRLRGCLELQVILRKRATNCSALLRKMTYEDKASYDSTPPCRLTCMWTLIHDA